MPPPASKAPSPAASRPPASPLGDGADEKSLPLLMHPLDSAALDSLRATLKTEFATAPPHTVQRLAELLRHPNAHYCSPTKYLRALQRVLSVSSPCTAFPLPRNPSERMSASMDTPMQNGGGSKGFVLGSDESLGGALLTPIPWLVGRRMSDGEEGGDGHALSPVLGSAEINGGINGAVTQSELLRQEQELGIIPTNQLSSLPPSSSPSPSGTVTGDPPALGPEDVGPQPEGTVFPDPPRTPEDIGSPPIASVAAAVDAQSSINQVSIESEATRDDIMNDASPSITATTEDAGATVKKDGVEDREGMVIDSKENGTDITTATAVATSALPVVVMAGNDVMQVDSDPPPSTSTSELVSSNKKPTTAEEDNGASGEGEELSG
jgi:hypothetical protein